LFRNNLSIEPNTGEVVLFTHKKKEIVKFLFRIHFQDMSFTLSKAFSTPEDSPTKDNITSQNSDTRNNMPQ
jgi:hypothetical protein